MSEYDKGYLDGLENGKKAVREELARNPSALFDMIPMIAENLQKQIEDQNFTAYQQEMINKAMRGEIPHSELFKILRPEA